MKTVWKKRVALMASAALLAVALLARAEERPRGGPTNRERERQQLEAERSRLQVKDRRYLDERNEFKSLEAAQRAAEDQSRREKQEMENPRQQLQQRSQAANDAWKQLRQEFESFRADATRQNEAYKRFQNAAQDTHREGEGIERQRPYVRTQAQVQDFNARVRAYNTRIEQLRERSRALNAQRDRLNARVRQLQDRFEQTRKFSELVRKQWDESVMRDARWHGNAKRIERDRAKLEARRDDYNVRARQHKADWDNFNRRIANFKQQSSAPSPSSESGASGKKRETLFFDENAPKQPGKR